MRKKTEQKNSECTLFSRSDINFKYVLNHSISYLRFLLFMGLLSPCHLKSLPHLPTMGDDILTQRQNRQIKNDSTGYQVSVRYKGQISKKHVSKSIVHLIKHANFQLCRTYFVRGICKN